VFYASNFYWELSVLTGLHGFPLSVLANSTNLWTC